MRNKQTSGLAKDQKLDKLYLMGVAVRMLPGMTVLEFAGLIKEWERRGFGRGRCVSELIIGAGELAQLRREARGEP